MVKKLKAPVGTDEANIGEQSFPVGEDGTVSVPDDSVETLVGAGGFIEVIDATAPIAEDDVATSGALLAAPDGALSVSWGGVTYRTMAGKVRVPHAAVSDLISHGYVEV